MELRADESLQSKAPVELTQESFNINNSSTETLAWKDEHDPENPYNWPVTKKWALTYIAAFMTFLTMMNGTIITVAHFEISDTFNVDETAFPHSYWPVTTWAIGGAFSALFILPLAEDLGTRPVFLSTYLILICFLVPQAVAQNYATLVVTRFFSGGSVAILANTAAGVMGNLWDTEWTRSVPVSLYIIGYMAGSSMGPVMGAAIYQALGWRWISYMQIIWFTALFPIYFFSFYESRGTAILARRVKAQNNTEVNEKISFSILLSEKLIPSAKRPIVLVLTEPVLFVSTMWSAFTVGTLFLFHPLHKTLKFPAHQSQKQGFTWQYWEASWVYLGGMFTYAWTSYAHIPWIAPAIGLAMVGAGSVLVVSGVSDYVVDAYSSYAGSAMGAVATGENIFSAFLPLATMSMYQHLGLQWASTLLALIALVLSLVPSLMFVWGKEVRNRSPFMNQMTREAVKPNDAVV
ncbi:hypothetical protein N7533_002096 [Penicillium manginii]|uniref:uncharacterized protein n=1 Tax=Penicillium manginii TaxID=203109 RepID=UPI0025472A95|nr:uncharacterized protein N7533_002096 [Penicillium manginii]KAJ5763415.1 hypothetical protein N7533_002096 [Penicillium manginii]